MVRRWTFHDPHLAVTYTFPQNPYQDGEPNVRKKVSSIRTTAVDGRRIYFEGFPDPQRVSFRGRVRSLADRDALQAWADKHYQILWTNDLGEQRWIWIHSFKPTRKRAHGLTYKAEYEIEAIVLDIA